MDVSTSDLQKYKLLFHVQTFEFRSSLDTIFNFFPHLVFKVERETTDLVSEILSLLLATTTVPDIWCITGFIGSNAY